MKGDDRNEHLPESIADMPRFDDGMLDLRELGRTLVETLVNEIMAAQADMLCEDVFLATPETATVNASYPPAWARLP